MLNKLADLACELDKRGYAQHADIIDELIKTLLADKEIVAGIKTLAEKKGACEMCGEFEKLTEEETGQGDKMKLCKQCKKDYGKK